MKKRTVLFLIFRAIIKNNILVKFKWWEKNKDFVYKQITLQKSKIYENEC